MKKCIWLLVISMITLSLNPSPSFAAITSVDSLIKKLTEKGILTEKEARELKGDIVADEKAVRDEGLKASLPSWVQDMKLKGDFRLRYQYERKATDTEARSRGRVRYRLGIETAINPKTKVAVGLASSERKSTNTNDPRSTNSSFQNTFERPEIALDYAYAEYQAMDSLKLTGGMYKFPDYLWTPTDMLWDGDINPHGGAAHWEHAMGSIITPYFNTGVMIMDENSNADRVDPFLIYTQGGVKAKKGDWSANVAGIYYGFNGIKGTCPDWSAATNTGITTSSNGSCSAGSLKYDYDSLGASAELALATPFGLNNIPEVGVFADFIHNIDADDNLADLNNLDDGDGWSIGARIGDKKVVSKGQWQLKYNYVNLGKDAFVDFTPDSDRHGGKTDVRGHEAILEYGLSKNVSLALDYYQVERIKAAEATDHEIQADLNFKF